MCVSVCVCVCVWGQGGLYDRPPMKNTSVISKCVCVEDDVSVHMSVNIFLSVLLPKSSTGGMNNVS